MTEPTFKDWKENNLCGVCPYRKEVQDRNAQLQEEVDRLQRELSEVLVLLSKP